MIVLGLDPSMTAYGWALVSRGERYVVLDAGHARTEKDAKKSHMYAADQDAQRITLLAHGLLTALNDAYAASHPHAFRIVCEAPAGSQHAVSAKALGQSLGVTLGVLASRGYGVRFVQAHEVKQRVGGAKDASKDAVALGVLARTGWRSAAPTKPGREAEHDAAAVALTLTLEELTR
jgi:Holliday junction resolvasome RuvABC endonuclease subunit